MDWKSLHMAEFGLLGSFYCHFLVYTLFAYRKNHRLNAVNLSKNNNGINVPKPSDALKYNISQKMRPKITMNVLSLHKV